MQVKHPDHNKPVHVKAAKIINCAGALSGQVAQMCGVGTEDSNAHHLLKQKVFNPN